MIRLLLDEGLPLRAANVLRQQGHSATHAREVGLAAAEDATILEFARLENFVCVTLDHDFHRILAESGARAPSTIFVRGQSLDYLAAAAWIHRLVTQLGEQLEEGLAVTATSRGVRLRKLPLR